MQINNLGLKDLTLEGYLKLCGVENPEEYLGASEMDIESPLHYDNIEKAVKIFKEVVSNDGLIEVIEDGDFDGMASTAIFYQYVTKLIKKIGSSSKVKILLHEGKERGLDDDEVYSQILEDKPSLVVIPDAGSADKHKARSLKSIGIDIIVLDHHDTEEENRVDIGALVNNRFSPNVINKDASGTLVTHKFVMMLDEEYGLNWAKDYWDLVGLSIISDSMNITSVENGFFVKYVLDKDNIKNSFIKAIFDKFIWKESYTQKDIAFSVVPKFNSVIRTNKENVQNVVKALIGNGDDGDIVDMCDKCHTNQRKLVDKISKQLIKTLSPNDNTHIEIFSCDDMPRSYSGLIAGKMASMLGKPCIVGKIKDGELLGSFRGEGITRSEMDAYPEVIFAKGHETGSFGISLDANNIDVLLASLNAREWSYSPHTDVVASLRLNCIPKSLWRLFEPNNSLIWGHGIEEPKLHITNINVKAKDIEWIGKTSSTMRISIGDMVLLKFKLSADEKTDIMSRDSFDMEIIGSLNVNEFNEEKTKQIMIDEYEIKKAKEISFDDFF